MTTSDLAFSRWHPRTLYSETDQDSVSLDELRDAAQREGYEKGYSEGLSVGKKELEEERDAITERLHNLMKALKNPFEKTDLDVSEYLLALALNLCRTILRSELSANREYIQKTVDEALSILASESGDITIFLHPDDCDLISVNWEAEIDALKVKSDPNLFPGDCRVQRNDSLVDATIEAQLQKLFMQLCVSSESTDSLGEYAEPLDYERVEATSKRLEGRVNED